MTRKEKGLIAVAYAITWFTNNGYHVLLPIGEPSYYDLVVEKDGELQKVEAKYTSVKVSAEGYMVDLRTHGGNRSSGNRIIKTVCSEHTDLLFAVCPNESYLIPVKEIGQQDTVTLGSKWIQYLVSV